MAYLNDDHISRIAKSYKSFRDESGFSRVASTKEVLDNGGNLSIPLYVKITNESQQESVKSILKDLRQSHETTNQSMETLFNQLHELGIEKD